MALTLQQIREKLLSQASKATNGPSTGSGDNAIFPHWDIPEGSTARLRFLPDADSNNPYFWIERQLIKLPFPGIKGQPDSKPVIVQVPCIEMWPDMGMCPILAEVRPWFKDKSLEEMGRKYWKKKSFLMQSFVRENPLTTDKAPENPIRRTVMSPQIFNLVKAALMDPELENLPTDYQAGLDFLIKKTSKGGFADYTTSVWARKESSLTAEEAAAIEKFGLFNLSDFLPKRPSADDLIVMKEMFEASVDGQTYDLERWGNVYRPYGVQAPGGSSTEGFSTKSAAPTPQPSAPAAPVRQAPAPTPAASSAAPWDDEDDDTPTVTAPVVTPPPAASGSRAEDILNLIRSRKAAQ